jgi:hypothetical protein
MNEYHITRAENGFVLRYDDMKVKEANRKDGAKWKDPMVTRIYETDAALIQDLAAMLPKMQHNPKKKAEDGESAFNEAFKSEYP